MNRMNHKDDTTLLLFSTCKTMFFKSSRGHNKNDKRSTSCRSKVVYSNLQVYRIPQLFYISVCLFRIIISYRVNNKTSTEILPYSKPNPTDPHKEILDKFFNSTNVSPQLWFAE